MSVCVCVCSRLLFEHIWEFFQELWVFLQHANFNTRKNKSQWRWEQQSCLIPGKAYSCEPSLNFKPTPSGRWPPKLEKALKSKPSLTKNNNYGLSRELDLIARENITIDIFKF
jgi:hypothetical protein